MCACIDDVAILGGRVLLITCSECLVGDEIWVVTSDIGVNNEFVRKAAKRKRCVFS